MKPKSSLRSFLALAGSSLLITVSHTFAASGTWNGTTNALWNLDSNWSAAFPVTGNTATFNNAGNGNTTIDLGAGASVTTVNFDTASAAAYTIGSGAVGSQTLTLGTTGNPAGTISMASTVVNNQVFNANLTLGTTAATGTYVLTNNSSSLLTVNGGMISGIGGTAGGKTLNVNGTGDTVLNGVLDRGTATSFFVQKNTAGSKLTLGGSSSNLNLTLNVNAGTVELNKSGTANAVSTGTVLVGGGSTLQYNASAGSDQIANALTVQLANSAGTATMNMNGVSDTIANLTFFGTSSTSTSQASVTTGAGILTIDNGTVTVNNNGASDNRGTATISGFLDVGTSLGMNGGRRNFNVADGAAVAVDLEVSAVISSSAGAFGVRKIGTGTMRLSGANTYDGANVIDNGTLEVTNMQDGGTASSLGDSSNAAANLVFVNDGKILRYVGSADATTNRAFTLSTTGATSSSVIESSGVGTLSFTNNAVLNAYSTNRTLVLGGTNTGANTFGKIISSSTTLNKQGSGTWVLDQGNTYTGATTVTGGKLSISSTGTINSTSGVTIGTASTAATTEFNYNSSTALTKAVSFAAGSTGGTLSGTGTINLAVNVTTGNTLAIGNSVGVMNFGDNLEVGGTYLYELNNTLNTADLGDVAGNLTLGGILDLVQLGAYTAGDKFTLFAYDGTLSGLFKDTGGIINILDDTNFTDAGGVWRLNYNDTTAGLNGGVSASNTYVTITAIPEPRAALLGGLGLLMLLRRRRA